MTRATQGGFFFNKDRFKRQGTKKKGRKEKCQGHGRTHDTGWTYKKNLALPLVGREGRTGALLVGRRRLRRLLGIRPQMKGTPTPRPTAPRWGGGTNVSFNSNRFYGREERKNENYPFVGEAIKKGREKKKRISQKVRTGSGTPNPLSRAEIPFAPAREPEGGE